MLTDVDDNRGESAAEQVSALRDHELFPYAIWGFVAFAAVAAAVFLSALSSERANSARVPILPVELRASPDEVGRLQETIDKLRIEQQRLAQRVEDFERTQSDLTASTPIDRKNVAWSPPPYPYGLKARQRGAVASIEPRERDVPIPPAPVVRDSEVALPVIPLSPRSVPLPPTPPREKEVTPTIPVQPERESDLLLPPPPTEQDLGIVQLPAARVPATPRIMDTRTNEAPRPPEAVRAPEPPRPPEPRIVETSRAPEPPRPVETPKVETPRIVETPRPVETARVAPPQRPVETARIIPPLPPETTQAIVTRTEFALDLGGETSLDGLRARWANLRGNHGQALENVKPLVALRESDQPGVVDFRLLVGPIANAADAARACARLNTTKIICAVTTYDGQNLELR